MFVQKTEGLGKLPRGLKLGITTFLLIAGIGYLLGFANIYLTYSPVDQKPGLSLDDIRIAFSGTRTGSAMERAIDGTMKQYFASDTERKTVKDWLASGASEGSFDVVKTVFANSCALCHSARVKTAGVALDSYADVKPYLGVDTGKSVSALVSISHTHVLAVLSVLFMLCLVFSFTKYPEGLKGFVLVASFLSVVADVGSWWLAHLFPGAAVLVVLGGAYLALTFAALILLSLYDLWLRRAAPEAAH